MSLKRRLEVDMNKAISRRLAVLQQIVDRNKPFKVKVLFTDGSEVITNQSGALSLLQKLGPGGRLDGFQTDNPVYSGWARLLTGILHPAPDRRIEDFE